MMETTDHLKDQPSVSGSGTTRKRITINSSDSDDTDFEPSPAKLNRHNNQTESDNDDNDYDSQEEKRQPKSNAAIFGLKTKQTPSAVVYKQKFRQDWKNTYQWLQESKKGVHYAYCKVCDTHMDAHLTAISRHTTRSKHLKAERTVLNQVDIFQATSNSTDWQRRIHEAETKMTMFLLEHNLPFNNADHLCQLIRNMDPEVIRFLQLGRTKATAITTNVIGRSAFESIVDILKNRKFSLIIDESTDCSTTKHLAMVVRYLKIDDENRRYELKDVFLNLLKITDASSKGIYTEIVNFMNENKIPYKQNLIGFAADGANVMMGKNSSVMTMLKNDIPNLFVLTCTCHSLALCSSYACKELPQDPEDLVKSIYNYFAHSDKRQTSFRDLQEALDVSKPHKILKVHAVRWLSMKSCIERTLEQYTVLKKYFEAEIRNDPKCTDAKNI